MQAIVCCKRTGLEVTLKGDNSVIAISSLGSAYDKGGGSHSLVKPKRGGSHSLVKLSLTPVNESQVYVAVCERVMAK